MESPTLGHDPIVELITAYTELNSSVVEELLEEPSPLEFMRYVARNTPFVVRGGAADWKATELWTAHFLADHLRHETVNVAVTPNGNADAPTPDADGNLVFAKPWEEDQPFPAFLDHLIRQEHDASFAADAEVRYAQTQNDNLRHEYAPLLGHVPPTIPFARVALGPGPSSSSSGRLDALNLWIGNARSVTALHRDSYENVYAVLRGRKHFVLLPPHCAPCVAERDLPAARWVRRRDGGAGWALRPDGPEEEEEGEGVGVGRSEQAGGSARTVPFATWDPDEPAVRATRYSGLARPLRVTLGPGDMLYLPALWYHKVSQSCGEDGICMAVNYWYGWTGSRNEHVT